MAQGMNNSAACRAVGIDRRTGTRWRYGRTVTNRAGQPKIYPPITKAPGPVSARYLSEDERVVIGDYLRAGRSIRAIAGHLSREPSTISREIHRNRDPTTGIYQPFAAQRRAAARRVRPKPAKLQTNDELRDLVQQHLNRRWSPEQISEVLRTEFPHRPSLHLAHETIYQALYRQDRGGLSRQRTPALRTGRTWRKRRRSREQRIPRFIDPMRMLNERPVEAASRTIAGHWEGDLIMGTHNRSAIGTLVERTTRFVVLIHLAHGRSTEHFRDALIAAFGALPTQLRRSLAWDQGIEMGRHSEFTAATGIPVYFCDPASPWQRGSNENTNGLLRQYFPKGTDLSGHSADHLAAVATEPNARPRKIHGWDNPRQTDR